MFKKLKDKIAEEVKQSPLKSVQQLAQAVVSPNSSSVFEPSSSNDKFCIEEGDIEEEASAPPVKSGGFTSVTLTGQTSSPLRDSKLSFRPSPTLHTVHEAENFFPVFEPQPTNFHVQSEAESASEVEDRYSQLEHINKESLYEAYRKVYNRYNRMKNKYHELVTHYRQLDREKERAKTVLTETQDKALLRISELREQCVLEQQAKAHLEEALRNELEERDHIISSLKTKVQYLKTAHENATVDRSDGHDLSLAEDENLIDFTDNSQVTKVPSPSVASPDSDWPEEQIKKCKEFFIERSARIDALKTQLEILKKSGVNWNELQKDVENDTNVFLNQDSTNPDSNIPESLDRLLNELTEEVKTVQNLTDEYIQRKPQYSSKVQADSEETEDNTIKSELKTNNNDELCLEKLVGHFKEENNKYEVELKALEKQNKDLAKQLEECACTTNLINKKYEDLNKTCTSLKSYLETVNNNCAADTLSSDDVGNNNSTNDELSHKLFACVQYLYSSKVELKSLKSQFEKLVKDHADLSDKLKITQEEKENHSKEVSAENKRLGEQLERLRKENNLLSSQQESLKIEVSDLRKEKNKVENQVKTLSDLVKSNEEDSKSKQEALKLVNLDFIEEKNTLQNKITALQSQLSIKDEKHSALQQEIKELNENLLGFKQERETLLSDKNQLQSKIEELKLDIEKTKQEHFELLKSGKEIANEVSMKHQELLNREKENMLIKINDFEKHLEKSKNDLLVVFQEKDKLSEELNNLKKDLENTSAEKLKLQTKLDHLEKELELSKQEYLTSSEALKQVTHNINVLSKQHQDLATEKNDEKKIIDELKTELEQEKAQNLSYFDTNGTLLQNIKALERRTKELEEEISDKLEKIKTLETEKENTNKLIMVESQSKKGLLRESMLEKESLISQINCLKKDINESKNNLMLACKREEEVNIKNAEFVEKVKTLEEELERRKEEFKSTMSEMMKTYEELSSEKLNVEKTIEELKLHLNSKSEESMSLKSINEHISQELISLKSIKDQDQKDNDGFKLKYDTLLAEFQENKEAKDKVNNELSLLTQEYKNTLTVMDGMKIELQNQQQLCSELNQSLNDLSESFQLKSNEIEKKCQENKRLRDELKSCVFKNDQTNHHLQKVMKEKHCLVEKIQHTLNDIKHLKKVQQNLMEFISQFEMEISEELSLVRIKTEKELFKNILQESEATNRHLFEIQMKSKEEMNAFNSKLKYLESELQKATDSLKANVCNQCKLENDGFSEISTNLSSSVHSTESSQVVCKNLQSNLCQAVKLLRFLKESFLSKQPVQHLNGIAHLGVNEVDLEMKENWSSEKMFLEIDLFLNTYENNSLDTNSSNLISKVEADEYLRENIPLEPLCDKEVIGKVHASNHSKDSEIKQLLQELNLKTERIIELQKIVTDYEQNPSKLKNSRSSSLLSLQSNESVADWKRENESTEEKWMILEQENQALMQKVLDLQESYELKIKNLVVDYENKMKEEDLFDEEKTSREKKNAISEMKEQLQNLQQDLEDRGDAFEKLYEDHQQTVKEREEEARQLRVNYEKEMREQDKKWRSCLDRRVAEEELRHQAEVDELTSEWAKQRKELETASRLAVSVVESGTSSSEMLRRQVQALTMQLHTQEANRCEMCDTKQAFSRERRKSNGSSRSIQDCTEMEYLRNILYEYMMGKEPLVLAKVLCALVKFDDTQTNDIVVKEQQKITLLGQLGLQ